MSGRNHNKSGKTPDQELGELWEEYQPMMFRTAKAHSETRQDAEDVVQTVFVRLTRQGISDELRMNPGGYLHQAAVNEAVTVHRSRQRQRVDSSVDVLKLAIPRSSPDHDKDRALKRAKAALREEAASIVDLHYTHGYTHQEIADLKGMKKGAITMSLSRSLEQLSQVMGYYEQEKGSGQ